MRKQWIVLFGATILLLGTMLAGDADAQTIQVKKLNRAPTLDGNANDWEQVEATVIPVAGLPGNKVVGVDEISVKAGVAGDSVYFLWQWKDDTEDIQHKPFVWDEKAGKYEAVPQAEDRFAVNFAMEGDFTYDWFSGQTFKADNWHWKAARTNPGGLAHDKMIIITTEPTKKAFKATARNNSEIYILRPSDQGDELYTTKRYAVKEKNMMPKYIMSDNPQGSVTDVKAKGVWKDGVWTLEFKRLLDTGHPDDLAFKAGDVVPAAIAVFNHTGDEHHNTSKTIYFQF